MKEINIRDLQTNPYTLFPENWAALCSGSEEDGFNAMTIAWGQIGSLWERKTHSNRLPVASVYVRQSRYTKQLMDKNGLFSISFMPENQKRALGYLGSHHGDTERDKIEKAGLTAIREGGTIYIGEARLVLICKKGFTNFREGDVVFAKITPCMENGKSAVIGKLVNDIGYGTTEFYVFRCGEQIDKYYLFHLLRSKKFRSDAKQQKNQPI